MNKDTPKPFFKNLLKKIKTKKARIGIVGMGYVGLPLAVCFAKNGFPVTGLDIDEQKVKSINLGKNYLEKMGITADFSKVTKKGLLKASAGILAGCQSQDVIIICVPTPTDKEHHPDIDFLKLAATDIGRSRPAGKLIINESTVAPFTTENIIGKIIQKESGLMAGKDFFLGCSPERINPGDLTHQVGNTAKIVAGLGKKDLLLVETLYRLAIGAKLVKMNKLAEAETVKLLENSYRAVNIALVNELAKYCQKAGLDILEIIEAAKTKWSFQAHYPGVGVGGHCIPVDPWYLLDIAEKSGVEMPALKEALIENDNMPGFVAGQVAAFYRPGKRVLVYGISYKGGVKDARESPALKLCEILNKRKIKFEVYDPFYTPAETKKLKLRPCRKLMPVDLLLVATDHSQLKNDVRKLVSKKTIIIDGRNFFKQKAGQKVIGVGRKLE